MIVLSFVLTTVFLLSVRMYDGIAAGTADGVLAAFAEDMRARIDENDAVSAFLGLSEPDRAETVSTRTGEDDAAKEAAEYIARYNAIFTRLE